MQIWPRPRGTWTPSSSDENPIQFGKAEIIPKITPGISGISSCTT